MRRCASRQQFQECRKPHRVDPTKNKLQHCFERRTNKRPTWLCSILQWIFFASSTIFFSFSCEYFFLFLGQVVGETYANEKHRQTLRIKLQNAPICQKLLRVSPWNSLQTLNLVLCTFRSSWVSCECRVLNLVRRLRVWHKINQRVFWFLGRHNISQLIEKIFPFIRLFVYLLLSFLLTKRIHI